MKCAAGSNGYLIYPPWWREEAHRRSAHRRAAHRPPALFTLPSYMSAESSELLWDDEVAAKFLESASKPHSPSSSPVLSHSASAGSACSTIKPALDLRCEEDPLALEDWIPNEEEEYSDSQPIPESARLLMEARMEAPQGGLDDSYASHSCEHPPRAPKRRRVYSVAWCSGQSEQRPVGIMI